MTWRGIDGDHLIGSGQKVVRLSRVQFPKTSSLVLIGALRVRSRSITCGIHNHTRMVSSSAPPRVGGYLESRGTKAYRDRTRGRAAIVVK